MTSEVHHLCIEPRKGIFQLDLKAIWQYRELLFFLVWRDFVVRYKQTAIGVGWAILQPLVNMIVFTVIFGMFAKIPSDGVPYPVFAYCALLPWNFFANALQRANASVVGEANLITKIYFPRLILPIAGTLSGLLDFSVSFGFLLIMLVYYGVPFTWLMLLVPAFLLLGLLTALAFGLWFAALNVRYRDIGHVIPFVVQVWMFISPIVYPMTMIPAEYQRIYSLNPMVGVIEGFRWVLLGKASFDGGAMVVSTGVVLVILVGGVFFFKAMEPAFADVV